MKAHNGTDQLVHPVAQVVKFETDAAHQTIIGPLREQYEKAAAFAYSEWEQADRCDADMFGWQQEIADAKQRIADDQARIAEREQWTQRRGLDRQQHLTHAQQAVHVANPAAAMLAVAEVQVPQVVRPLPSLDLRPIHRGSHELAEDPDANMTRFQSLHTEYTATNPEPEL